MKEMTSTVRDLFDKQVGLESRNALFYLNASAEAARLGYPGFEKRWKDQAKDEFHHATKFMREAARLSVGPLNYWPLPMKFERGTMVEVAEAAAAAEEETEEAMAEMIRVCEESCPAAAAWVSDRMADQSAETKSAADMAQAVREASASNTLSLLDREA